MMKKIALLGLIVSLLIGCSQMGAQESLNPDDPSTYKDNKTLTSYLEKEGFDVDIPARDTVFKYNLPMVSCYDDEAVQAIYHYAYDRYNNGISPSTDAIDLRKAIETKEPFDPKVPAFSDIINAERQAVISVVEKGDCRLYNPDREDATSGFVMAKINHGKLKYLEKYIGTGKEIGKDGQMDLYSAFVSKYRTDGLILIYDKNTNKYIYKYPLKYYIRFHNRCVKFTLAANTNSSGTVLVGSLDDDDLVEKLSNTQNDVNKKKDESNNLKKLF